MICNLGDPMSLRHLVVVCCLISSSSSICKVSERYIERQRETERERARERVCVRLFLVVASPKLQTIFHKRAIKYRSLLQKMTYEDKGS